MIPESLGAMVLKQHGRRGLHRSNQSIYPYGIGCRHSFCCFHYCPFPECKFSETHTGAGYYKNEEEQKTICTTCKYRSDCGGERR